ncbi:indole-3-glycerol phosphate synthase [Fomitopsis betulina]|nr:indole-3-glycerol phosphate synthase [Fomitopsis betulina]
MSDAASKPPTILEKIYAQRQKDVEIAKATPGTRPEELEAYLKMGLAPPLIPLVPRLKRNPSSATARPSLSLMAEIKRASPSKGDIALHVNPASQALLYAQAGASVISPEAVDALPDRPALLRKEFVFSEYQIAEARLWGADTVLLIVAMLAQEQLERLYAYAVALGMEPLVEVNNAPEMERALAVGAKVVGVNNRNLHDFSVDMGTTSGLVDMVRERNVILCALSGIQGPEDVKVYGEQGVHAVLVGESLMRAADTTAFIKRLLQWPDA